MFETYSGNQKYPRAFIFAPGDSLKLCDIDACIKSKTGLTIAIGNAHRLANTSDILYHSDAKWWNFHKGQPNFAGKHRVCIEPTLHKDVRLIGNAGTHGLSAGNNEIFHGQNSGYAALNLAVLHGVKEVILLGYDMGYGPAQKDNFCGNHPAGVSNGFNPKKFKRFIKNFDYMLKPLAEMGVRVYNCNEGSALECFPKVRLRDVL